MMKRLGFVIGMMTLVGMLLTACGTPTPVAAPTPDTLDIQLSTYPTPPKSGDIQLVIMVKDGAGKVVEGAEVRVNASMTAMDMGRKSGKATDQGNGRYALVTNLAEGGEWKFTIQVDKPGLPQGIKEVKLNVK